MERSSFSTDLACATAMGRGSWSAAVTDRRYRRSPPKPGHDFVGDEQRAVAARDFRHPAQPAARLRNHSCRALNQRFKDKRRVGISLPPLRCEFLFGQPNAFPVAFAIFAGVGAFRLCAIKRTPIAIRRHDLVRLEQQTGITFMEQTNVTERNRADRVAVIGAFE